MNFEPFLQPLRDDARALATRCRDLQSHPAIAQLALRLSQLAGTPDAIRERPVIAALIGGTGVGKSQLFNALLARPEASATSSSTRLKTRHPVIARRPAEQALLPDFGGGDVQWIDAPTPWLALADTPDLDGMDLRHREITERVIALADILIFVSNPEKRANFALLETVRAWAGRKRWFFVLNQADTVAADLDAVRADFDRRLVELDFAPDDATRFLISALDPQRFDFARLRDTLLRERPREAAAALAVDAALGQALHAAEPATLDRLTALHDEIAARETAVSREIIQRVHDAIERRQLAARLVPLLRRQVWTALPARVGGPLALPVLIHARLTGLASAFQLWRITTGGFTLWRLGLLATTLFAAMRGSLEVRGLLARVEEEVAAPLADLSTDVGRFLADRQLALPARPVDSVEPDRELRDAVAAIPGAGSALARVVDRLTAEPGGVTRELAPLITEAIDRRAEEAAAKCVGFFTQLLNLLPLAAIGFAGYEIVATWILKEWLPGAFYLHAAAVFLLTLLPGYLVICLNVARQLRRAETLASILAAADKLPPTGPAQVLAAIRADLATILTGLTSLRTRANSTRAAIDAEFGVAQIGARLRSEPETRGAQKQEGFSTSSAGVTTPLRPIAAAGNGR